MNQITGRIIDLIDRRIFPATVSMRNGRIVAMTDADFQPDLPFILPGFIDAHIHIESSMLIPSEFARLATVHGTVGTISDPHEIANVLGIKGVRYMIENGKSVPFHFTFGAPSCVPATSFETAGAVISAEDIQELFERDGLHYLSEVMNFPGVIQRDPSVMKKIKIAQERQKPIDGHAPGLRGDEALRYISAGISTDHECISLEEAEDKLNQGMKILIREGSAARNFEALHPLIKSHPLDVMFCSDDKHPHELVKGHIDQLVRQSIFEKNYDLMDVLRIACYNPILHYQLDSGLLRIGDSADFIIVKDLATFQVQATYIKGNLVAQNGKPLIQSVSAPIINHFNCHSKKAKDFFLPVRNGKLRVIEAVDGQLITKEMIEDPLVLNGGFASDPSRDLLKITVVNRYQDAKPSIGFIHNFGLQDGAIASCIAHDSHNIICVGVSDEDICSAVNAVIENKGGLAIAVRGTTETLPLPIGGIMSGENGYTVAEAYLKMERLAKKMGTKLEDPFMTLSFMALLVIPSLKISDKGLFDGNRFQLISLTAEDQ